MQRNYTNDVNQALNRCFFSVFSENLRRGTSIVFPLSIIHVLAGAAGFHEFPLNFKNKIAEIL